MIEASRIGFQARGADWLEFAHHVKEMMRRMDHVLGSVEERQFGRWCSVVTASGLHTTAPVGLELLLCLGSSRWNAVVLIRDVQSIDDQQAGNGG